MHIYFSGLGGVAIGPLAEIARDAGYTVSGSDRAESLMTAQLGSRGIEVSIGQDGSQVAAAHATQPIDWLIYTAALTDDHPELRFAREHGIKTGKRDQLLAHIIAEKKLKLIAVSGSHGKTTTTGMLVWAFKQLNLPVSYSVGTTVSFGPSGAFDPASDYFIYECDEFDRNMLQFEPHLSLITSLEYDHPDTYASVDEYRTAFVKFCEQSGSVILWEKDLRFLKHNPHADLEAYDEHMDLSHLTLPGAHVRQNAFLVERALGKLFPDLSAKAIVSTLNSFPGTARRFEKLSENLYTDYGHHPSEITATLQLAHEVSDHVVLVYQPHQNTRQYEVRDMYSDCVGGAKKIYWLPTYLSREDESLAVLTPKELVKDIANHDAISISDMDETLWHSIEEHRSAGDLVLVMGAGDVDSWVRKKLGQ